MSKLKYRYYLVMDGRADGTVEGMATAKIMAVYGYTSRDGAVAATKSEWHRHDCVLVSYEIDPVDVTNLLTVG